MPQPWVEVAPFFWLTQVGVAHDPFIQGCRPASQGRIWGGVTQTPHRGTWGKADICLSPEVLSGPATLNQVCRYLRMTSGVLPNREIRPRYISEIHPERKTRKLLTASINRMCPIGWAFSSMNPFITRG